MEKWDAYTEEIARLKQVHCPHLRTMYIMVGETVAPKQKVTKLLLSSLIFVYLLLPPIVTYII